MLPAKGSGMETDMKKGRKLLLFVLSFLLFLLFCSPVTVSASETTDFDGENREILSLTYRNPLYDGIFSEEQIPDFAESDEIAFYAEPMYLTDADEVAEEIRSAMEERVENFTLYYAGGTKFSQGMFENWIEAAVSETGIPTQGDYLRWQYGGCDATAKISQKNGLYYHTIDFSFAYYTTYEEEEYVDEAVDRIIEGFQLSPKASNYRKIRAVYDYICENVAYDYDHLSDTSYYKQFTAYAALHDGTAVCQGYANLMYRMLYELGVKNRLIPGTSQEELHAWNIAEINGIYYCLDSTWDAGQSTYGYFLKGKNDFPNHTNDENYRTEAFFKKYPVANNGYDESTVTDFDDVSTTDWYAEAVTYVNDRGLMTGLGNGRFGPTQNLARAQFAVILYRMEGEPEVEYSPRFPDVGDNIWYTDAIMWASDAGIITGYSNTGKFGPADKINREQMAVMMFRYAGYLGCDTDARADISGFADGYRVSSYAKEAMQWAYANGIITGKYNETYLEPQGNASRAECATIISRFIVDYRSSQE